MSAPHPITKKDMIRKIRRWLEEERFPIHNFPDPTSEINWVVTFVATRPADTRHINVAFPKKANDVVDVIASLGPATEVNEKLGKLTPQQKDELMWDLRFSLLSYNVAFTFAPDNPNTYVRLWRNIYFDGLTKNMFMEDLAWMVGALTMVVGKLNKAVGESAPTDGVGLMVGLTPEGQES